MAYIIATILTGLILFIVGESIASFLPESIKPRLIFRGLFVLYFGAELINAGVFGVWQQPIPQTVATLMEQVRGDELHWNKLGKTATVWEEQTHRRYKKSCQAYAIEQLGELGPAASEALPELIELFNEQPDYDTGDGVHKFRSQIAETFGRIGQSEAIDPMIEMLLGKSLSTEEQHSTSIQWHNEEYEDRFSGLKRGTGPQAIMMGLMLMPQQHHGEILEKLKVIRAEIERSDLFNEWAKFEIDRGIGFFEADAKTRTRLRNRIDGSWYLEDTLFDDLLAPTTKVFPQASVGKR